MVDLIIPKHVARAETHRRNGILSAVTQRANASMTLAEEIALPVPTGGPVAIWWRVVITPVGLRQQSKGGIALTEKMIEDQLWLHGLGKIVSVGSLAFGGAQWAGCAPHEIPKPGDVVLYNPKTPNRVKRNGTWFMTVNDDHIQNIVNPGEADGYVFFDGLET